MSKADTTKGHGETDAKNLAAAGHGKTGEASGSDAGKSAADTAKDAGGTSHADNLKDGKAPAPHADPAAKQSSTEADAEAARIRQATEDANRSNASGDLRGARDPLNPDAPLGAAEAARRHEKTDAPAVSVNDPSSHQGKVAQHRQVDEENEKRNEANLEGHEKNVQRDKDNAARGHEEYQRTPPTGKQRDENTPTVLPDGSKVWK